MEWGGWGFFERHILKCLFFQLCEFTMEILGCLKCSDKSRIVLAIHKQFSLVLSFPGELAETVYYIDNSMVGNMVPAGTTVNPGVRNSAC